MHCWCQFEISVCGCVYMYTGTSIHNICMCTCIKTDICTDICVYFRFYLYIKSSWKRMLNHVANADMGWLRQVGSIKLLISFAKEPYKRDYILHKRPTILSILLTKATPYPLKKRTYAHIYGVSNLMYHTYIHMINVYICVLIYI